jgi:hypothetical protein
MLIALPNQQRNTNMTKFTQSQIQDKARQLVEKHVVQSIQDLIDFVNEHDPDMIYELVSDAHNGRDFEIEEQIEYLKSEHSEDYNAMLEEIFESEDWYDDLSESKGFASVSFHAYLDAELQKDPDLFDHYISSLFDEKRDNEDQPEILQFVQLSNDWIARKLREQGEIVIELLGLDIWCRQCFGQAFYIDPCWEALATEELEKYGLDN